MNSARKRANLLLLSAAFIWGVAFVAQRVAMRHLPPLTFNAARLWLGALVLLPFLAKSGRRPAGTPMAGRGEIVRASMLLGLVMFAAASLQQFGIVSTTAGKAGFITSMYVVFVPVVGSFVGHRVGRYAWTGVALAVGGLYLLSARGVMKLAPGDGLVLLCAVCWTAHVLLVGRFVKRVPAVRMAFGQFTTAAVLSTIGALVFDHVQWADLRAVTWPILYSGVFSIGVAFTLQVAGQKNARPTDAAIIMSMESVFAALGGGLLLGERLGLRELAGCAAILTGAVVAQRDLDDTQPRLPAAAAT
jgi:drug/metabolite transporter (DMT)-like permease